MCKTTDIDKMDIQYKATKIDQDHLLIWKSNATHMYLDIYMAVYVCTHISHISNAMIQLMYLKWYVPYLLSLLVILIGIIYNAPLVKMYYKVLTLQPWILNIRTWIECNTNIDCTDYYGNKNIDTQSL